MIKGWPLAAFVAIDPEDLETQAETLLGKRLHEVAGACRSELNVVAFSLRGRRLKFHLPPDAWVGGRPRRALQVLWRGRRGAVRGLSMTLVVRLK